MAVVFLVLPFLAAFTRFVSASCSVSATTTIQGSADIQALAACTTFTGSIAIATGTTENINISKIRTIRGNLIASNVSQMTQFGADSLEIITDTFGLNDVQILNQLDFPRLTSVQNIIWQGLPNLNTLNFDAQIQQASKVDIQNTFLSSLEGINLKVADKFYMANNGMLQDVTLQITNISTSLTLVNNGDRLTASFPNLLWAYNLTFRDVPSVSLPSLKFVNGSLGFYENTVKSLSNPNLTRVGGTFSIISNTELTNTSFPQLTTIDGGFQIANNSKLSAVDGFPRLRNIGGAFDCNGNFAKVSLPALGDVRGAFNLQSTEDIANTCSAFKSVNGPNKVIKGKFTCAGDQTTAGGSGTTPSTSGGKGKGNSASRYDSSLLATISCAVVFMLGVIFL